MDVSTICGIVAACLLFPALGFTLWAIFTDPRAKER